jgi:hypothetical protein
MKLYENEGGAVASTDGPAARQSIEDEEMTELDRLPTPVSLASEDSSQETDGSKK